MRGEGGRTVAVGVGGGGGQMIERRGKVRSEKTERLSASFSLPRVLERPLQPSLSLPLSLALSPSAGKFVRSLRFLGNQSGRQSYFLPVRESVYRS